MLEVKDIKIQLKRKRRNFHWMMQLRDFLHFKKLKFDETVEISMFLGVDPKQSSQSVRGVVNLPHGSGKEIKVLVFTETPDEATKLVRIMRALKTLSVRLRMVGLTLMWLFLQTPL